MNQKYYKIIIIGLLIVLSFSTFMAYQYNQINKIKPDYLEAREEAYQKQICDLQKQLNYPVCQVDGKFIEFDK